MMSTQEFADAIKQQYCEYFGVDDFDCTYSTEQHTPKVKQDIIYSCFGLFRHLREVKFYNQIVRWKIKDKSFQALLTPTIKKYKKGRNTYYCLDEEKMKNQILYLIKESYERH